MGILRKKAKATLLTRYCFTRNLPYTQKPQKNRLTIGFFVAGHFAITLQFAVALL
jgi:hypothetical protein